MSKPHFNGPFDELKARLKNLKGEWKEISNTQKQFRSEGGGILNFFPSTGTLTFQGSANAAAELLERVAKLLNPAATSKPTEVQAQDKPTGGGGLTSQEAPAANAGGENLVNQWLGQAFSNSELVIGLVGAVGTKLSRVSEILKDRLTVMGYEVEMVRMSKHIIPQFGSVPEQEDEYHRISAMMDAGNESRRKTEDNSVLALGAAAWISSLRKKDATNRPEHYARRAYIVNSLKHPEEVLRLREIYPQGFYLIGVHCDRDRRKSYLEDEQRISPENADRLMGRDEDEHLKHGQRVTDTFHMSDFFVRMDSDDDKLRNSIWRTLDILFGHPNATPTFDEYAMFIAFSAALRSADLSRQVGAVITQDREIIATGANDCPKYGGGLYWPEYNEKKRDIEDAPRGRDYTRGVDANKEEQKKLIDDILGKLAPLGVDVGAARKALEQSAIQDLTEFGRVVHAEMEALLCCARNKSSTQGGTIYCTTFPCHNCAKHIVAAGIERVVYIEPYPKSKAATLHDDSIVMGFQTGGKHVGFEPFVGVGPRRFFDLFSMRLGSGYPLKRKDAGGKAIEWEPEAAKLRMQMLPVSYLDLEIVASAMFEKMLKLSDG